MIDPQRGQITLRRHNDDDELEYIESKVDNFYFPLRHGDYELTEMSKGDLVAAKTYRQQTWWRAKILDVNVDHEQLGAGCVRVRLLDRGKNVVVLRQNLKQLAGQFLIDEMMSITVHLANAPQPIQPFTNEHVNTIKQFFAETAVMMSIVRTPVDSNSPFGVRLFNKKKVTLRL